MIMKGQTEIIILIIIVAGILIAYGISQINLTIDKDDLNLTTITQLPISNITNLIGSSQCGSTDKVRNVTIANSGLSIICDTDVSGGGGGTTTELPESNIKSLFRTMQS